MVFGKVSVVSHPRTSSFLFLRLIVDARPIRSLAKRRFDTASFPGLRGFRQCSEIFLWSRSTLGRDWYAAPHYRGGETFISEYIIKFNRTFTNTTGDLVTEGTWQDAWWVALRCVDSWFWLTWFT